MRGECVAVVDLWLIIRSVPAVQLHTAAALLQSSEGVTTSISHRTVELLNTTQRVAIYAIIITTKND